MAGQKTQMENLSSENARLQAQIEKLEKEIAQKEYRQGLKERTFWVGMPTIWFAIAEAEFKVAGVIDDFTKFNYVLSQLPAEVSEKVKDVIDKPPCVGKYAKLKEEIIRRLSKSEHETYRQLFDDELGDMSPSQFYRHLQHLAGAKASVDKFLLHLWLRRLPRYCQEILSTRPEQSNTKLAELADNIMEATKASEKTSTKKSATITNIQQSVDDLSKHLVALEVSMNRQMDRSRSRSKSKPRSRSATPPASSKPCWYHTTYGSAAYRCVSPCDWSESTALLE
ncbi:uncharacterized protein LOC113500711 [Trichoplusia ni]|uniref:Uncharacterized protein LOC113500711 n=1 Tax=Trichoplusia ni TaxID=7111 RepID=A0A7E5W9S7_TRINI|nr:uncharacterized protein LOC113500711 [Trichoplusia ni]